MLWNLLVLVVLVLLLIWPLLTQSLPLLSKLRLPEAAPLLLQRLMPCVLLEPMLRFSELLVWSQLMVWTLLALETLLLWELLLIVEVAW